MNLYNKIYNNIKINKLKQWLPRPVFLCDCPDYEQDISALGRMCKFFDKVVSSNNLLHHKHSYFYFWTKNERDLWFAKKIFSKNGIRFEIHSTKVHSDKYQSVLRVRLNSLDQDTVAFVDALDKNKRYKNEIERLLHEHSK